jgi:Prim-pol 4
MELKKWLDLQKYSWARSPEVVSHYFFDGGKAAVPNDMAGTFNNVYAGNLYRGAIMFAIEKKPEIFKLVFDLDMQVVSPIELAQVLELSQAVHEAVVEFYGICSDMIVCTCDPRPGIDTHWKMGAHLVWPSVFTTSPDALRCREHVLASPKVQAFAELFENTMEQVIDRSVLDKNGLRMIGSYKTKNAPCPLEVYWPRYLVSNNGVREIEKLTTPEELRHWVRETSLRCIPWDTRPCSPALSLAGPATETDFEEGLFKQNRTRLLCENLGPLLPGLDEFIASLPAPFHTSKFTAVSSAGTEDDPIFLARSTSRFCLNIGKNHNSNNVYFLFSKKAAYQMCFCRCQTLVGRKYGCARTSIVLRSLCPSLSLLLCLAPKLGRNKRKIDRV